MMKQRICRWIFLIIVFISAAIASAQQPGSIRGTVYDKDFDAPLAAAEVSIVETGKKVTATEEGNFVFPEVEPGTYTLVFSKESYTRQVKSNVVVSSGKMTELDASLAGEFTEMDEFVVQDVQIGAGTEESLLNLRMESPALMDSIGSEMMSRAGASDAASALRLVSGTTVQDGKYAVVRGLPDRYVSNQMNGVRLPTADTDKRAVQLDQFPAAAIESIQVTKTFTPDQQGDASGGAVNIVLKGIPDKPVFMIDSQVSYNTQVGGAGDDFLTWKGAGMDYWGKQSGSNEDAIGVSRGSAPTDYKYSVAAGDKLHINDDDDKMKIGGFASYFYEQKSSFFDNGIDDKYAVVRPGAPMTPQTSGSPDPTWNPKDPYNPPMSGDFRTALFDVTQGSTEIKWGGLGGLGLETESSVLSLLYMYTQAGKNTATLAENTRGKKYYFPDYDRNNPADPGNNENGRTASPYLRLETLEYTKRTTDTLQLHGKHTLPDLGYKIGNYFRFAEPEIDWTVAHSTATMDQPDKRMFGEVWQANGQISYYPSFQFPENHSFYLPSQSADLGNIQQISKNISEESNQYFANLKLPFEQWSGDKGYLKFGVFEDKLKRDYNQDTFSNPSDQFLVSPWNAPWEKFWSDKYPSGTTTESFSDIDYHGDQEISALYYMTDMPLNSYFNIIGGVRLERTELSIQDFPDRDPYGNIRALWFDPAADFIALRSVQPGAVYPNGPDVDFSQNDVLPSIGFVFKPVKEVQLHGSYSQTVARQTFKELSPILQQEYLGGPIFVGNPGLQMSKIDNYDLRLDWNPYEGGLLSASYFYKDVKNPIEYVQGYFSFDYTYPVNYPKGTLSGYEFEIRQKLDRFWKSMEGFSIGGNVTLINSEVTLPKREADSLRAAGFPEPTRDMTNAPEFLYNIFTTYDIERTGTQLALFYTVRGDMLIAGAADSGSYMPSVYEKEYGTLNFSWLQKLGKIWKLKFQAKNLLNPAIDTVYRSDYIDGDVQKTSYTKGIEYSIGLSANF